MRARTIALTEAARQKRDLIAEEEEAEAAKARAMTLSKLTDLYLARCVTGRLRSARPIERTIRSTLDPLMSMIADNVRRRDLLPLLEAIAAKGHERAAGVTRQRIGSLFKWAESQVIISNNPTRGLPTYSVGTPRDRVLKVDEIRLLWPWFENLPPRVCEALRLQLSLGARIGEVAGMLPNEIDRDEWLWTLPIRRSKNKRSRVTPLVGLARTIVEARFTQDRGDDDVRDWNLEGRDWRDGRSWFG